MTKEGDFALPPWQNTTEGELRRVGIELEMNGLELDEIAQLTADFLNCEVTQTSRYERSLKGLLRLTSRRSCACLTGSIPAPIST